MTIHDNEMSYAKHVLDLSLWFSPYLGVLGGFPRGLEDNLLM